MDEMCPYTFPMKDFVRLCCRARVKPARLAAYLSQGQKAIPENEIQTYKDYLDMAKALGWDMKNDTVRLPKNLHRRHDEAVIEINIKLANEGIKLADDSIIKRRAKYNFEMGDYLIRCAVSANEIIREGKTLQHCVGGYAQRFDDLLSTAQGCAAQEPLHDRNARQQAHADTRLSERPQRRKSTHYHGVDDKALA